MDILQPVPVSSTADPLITVAIPTFNRVEWLKDCIATVLAQSYQRFEVVVSDNASTDGTAAFLATISDPRLRVVRQQSNIGLNPNWNACLKAAKGDYIVFVPDDDRIGPHFLERSIALLRTNPDLTMVLGLSRDYFAKKGEYSITGEKGLRPFCKSSTLNTGISDGTDVLLEFLKYHIVVQMCTLMMRTESVRARGGYRTDLTYAGDLATWMPLLLTGKCGFINECCGTFVTHEESLSSTVYLEVRLRDHRAAVNELLTMTCHSIHDPAKRLKIEMEVPRNIAHTCVFVLVEARIRGESLANILPIAWRFRQEIVKGRVSKLILLVQFLFLPTPAAVAARDLFTKARATAAQVPALKRLYRKLIPLA